MWVKPYFSVKKKIKIIKMSSAAVVISTLKVGPKQGDRKNAC